nr:hypothetical protein CFP56_43731 [Quercus suber]
MTQVCTPHLSRTIEYFNWSQSTWRERRIPSLFRRPERPTDLKLLDQKHFPQDAMAAPVKATLDPLWQCLCPSWNTLIPRRSIRHLVASRTSPQQCLNKPVRTRADVRQRRTYTAVADPATYKPIVERDLRIQSMPVKDGSDTRAQKDDRSEVSRVYSPESLQYDGQMFRSPMDEEVQPEDIMAQLWPLSINELYERIQHLADTGKVDRCRAVADFLIRKRKVKPSLQLYTALILSNTSQHLGSAWLAAGYMEEMQEAGIQADSAVCHAILKVCSVHPDHLLRTDVLHYMASRWFHLSDDGARDVVISMLREGLFEQALERLDSMSKSGTEIPSWLWDMAIYSLCLVGEVEEATRILRERVNAGEMHISRGVWNTILDEASSARYHPGVSYVWSHQVKTGYLNPASGICLNVLSTASQAGDAVLGTDVFTHLSKRGAVFQAVHYEQLMTCYLSIKVPDLKRALSVLTIMASENLEPTATETRSLYLYLRDKPSEVNEALLHLRALHQQGRRIPIAALNLLIESYLDQNNVDDAMKVYKLIHTFVPRHAGAQKSFANIDTFNFLLRGCRTGPDARLAGFLVSELLALRIVPNALTYDRLILVFVLAGRKLVHTDDSVLTRDPFSDILTPTGPDAQDPDRRARGLELLDWAFRHFQDMQTLDWLPRFGTIEKLAVELAAVADERCWDVLQAGEDNAGKIEGWEGKGKWVRRNVERAWVKVNAKEVDEEEISSEERGMTTAAIVRRSVR